MELLSFLWFQEITYFQLCCFIEQIGLEEFCFAVWKTTWSFCGKCHELMLTKESKVVPRSISKEIWSQILLNDLI